MGSFKDKTFTPTEKIILQVFTTLEEAISAEIYLHHFYEVNVNPHFANRAKQTAISFSGGAVNKRWWTDGTLMVFTEECPEGFLPGRTPEKESTKQKKSQSHCGKKHTSETKEKIREASTGRKHTEESKQKIGDANRGKERSEEVKAAISKANTGKVRSLATRKRMSEAQKGLSKGKGVPKSPEHRAKIAEAMRGNKNRATPNK